MPVLRSARNKAQTQPTSDVTQARTETKCNVWINKQNLHTQGPRWSIWQLSGSIWLSTSHFSFWKFFSIYRCLVQGHTTALCHSWLSARAAQPWGKGCKELWKNTVIGWSGQLNPLDTLKTLIEKKILLSKTQRFVYFFSLLLQVDP